MSDKKISELLNTTELTDDDVFPIVQGNLTKKIKWLNIFNIIKDYINTGLSSKLDKTITVTETGTSCNDYKDDGVYWFGTAETRPTDTPEASTYGWLQVMSDGGNNIRQIWHRSAAINGANEFKTFVRKYSGNTNTWSTWERLATEHDCYYMAGDSFSYYVKSAIATRTGNFWFQIPLNKSIKSGVTPTVTIDRANLFQSSNINVLNYISTITPSIAGTVIEVKCDFSSTPPDYSVNLATVCDIHANVTFS